MDGLKTWKILDDFDRDLLVCLRLYNIRFCMVMYVTFSCLLCFHVQNRMSVFSSILFLYVSVHSVVV